MKVDVSFIATLLETLAVAVIYLAWRNITEGMSNLLNSTIHLVAELLSSLYQIPGKTKPTTHNLIIFRDTFIVHAMSRAKTTARGGSCAESVALSTAPVARRVTGRGCASDVITAAYRALFHLPSTVVLIALARPFSGTASLVLSIFTQCQSTSRPQPGFNVKAQRSTQGVFTTRFPYLWFSSAENCWPIVETSASNTLAVPTILIIRTPSPAHPQPT
ncbi:hypothetical protein M422DRAFT_267504 [Sphaerobolus stellatus SS14]|uniref:Uncharacterized protein n=1 Tax=Sphaerobolus stellatus (strain SS14) TaxID=990650 RepID=A0A0C9UPM3_SPHS4|nr:hypothetical protein M422DRAFT_267504 [Sphaerobolus stellatus SS14]